MSSVIGVDLGGTKIALARFGASAWDVQEEMTLETHAEKALQHVLEDVFSAVLALRKEDTTGLGVGVPGLVRWPGGSVVTMPNIPESDDVPLRRQLEEKLRIPVTVDNDANCFALAEALQGAGRGHDIVIGITIGTGVGGGIVLHGKLYRGHAGFAAEIGHMLLKPGEPPFVTDDKRGDAEQFISGSAMGRRCSEARRPEEYLEGEVCGFLQPAIFREVAWMCANLTHLLDPSTIVFGGSAGLALGPHLDEVRGELTQWVLPGTPLPELAVATLSDAGTRGAALLLAQQSLVL